MGLENSKISTVYRTISEWDWSRTLGIIKAYNDEEHDFGIDIGVVQSLTALPIEDSKLLMKLLAKSDSGFINAITMLISFICVSATSRSDIFDLRLEALFDLVDFSNSGHLNLDEMNLLLYCTGCAISAILQQQNSAPNENLISKLVSLLREDLHKDSAAHVSKSEFISWASSLIHSTLPPDEITLQNIYQRILLSPFREVGRDSIAIVSEGKEDEGTIDESTFHHTVSTTIDSLHPDYKDDETIATREDD